MMFLCVFLISLVIVRLLIASINYFSFAYLPKVAPLKSSPFVSILIPARNEEENIGTLLAQLEALEYDAFEIIVYNDHSTDKTESIVKDMAIRNPVIKMVNGFTPPQGWLGKNYACHQLAQAATGQIYLFLDADVRVEKDLVKRSVSHFQKYQLDLLSIFPKQIVKSIGEKISVPLLNWILLSMLPLFLIQKLKGGVFSAANGQFMMFRAATYQLLQPHEKCKSDRVEDIAIIRLFKQKNLASDIRLGDKDLSCRMYVGLDDAIDGFTKSIFQFFGNSKVATVFFGFVTTIAPFLLYYKLGVWWMTFYVLGMVLVRILVSLASQQSVLQNLVLAIPQHLIFLIIITKGLITNKQKKLLWKGRNILQDL